MKFATTDLTGTVPVDYAFTAGDAGFKTALSATLRTAGLQDLSATDTVDGAITGSQVAISVGAAATSQLLVAGYTSPSVAGVARTFTVTARDGFGNTTPAYAGTVAFTTTSANRTLPANYTFVPGTDAGVHSFTGSLNTVGTHSLTATDTVTATITGQQTGIVINPAPASVLVVDSFPSPTTAGVAGSIRVTARDGFGNTATGYLGTIAFSSTDPNRALPTNYAFTAGDAGVHLFTNGVTLRTAGTQSVTATDTVTATITGTQAGILVNPAAAASLLVDSFPSPVTAGTAGDVRVTARDAFNNVATGYLGTIAFGSSDANRVLPANYTFTAVDAGVRLFVGGATLRTAGLQSISATDTLTATITGAQTAIQVNPAAAASLVVAGYPSPQPVGAAGTFSVTALDAFNNLATGYRGTVAFTSTDGAATLPANYTFIAADNGTKSGLSATFNTAGTHTLTGRDTVTATITGSQAGISITSGALSGLVYTDPVVPPSAKIKLVKNPASTPTMVVLDLVAVVPLTGYSVGFNLPLDTTRVTANATLMTNGTVLNPGSAPVAAGARIPATGPLASALVSGLSQKAAGTGAVLTDTGVPANGVFYTLRLDAVGGAPIGTVFDGAALGAKFRAAMRNKVGSDVVLQSEFAIGKLEVR